jgi:hypothetical protein
MALLTRKRLILLESESTYGTDPTPTGVDAVLVRDLNITPQQSDLVSRDLVRPYLGASEQLLANTRVECTFSVELAGSGAVGTAPGYSKALLACGLAETVVAATSVTYAPVSTSFGSCTIYYNIDGVLHKVTGSRGTFVLNATVGQIPTLDFTFTGIYNPPIDEALPAVTYANQGAPGLFKSDNTTGFSLLGYSGCLQTLSFDIGNNIIYRELVGCPKQVLITDRSSSGSVTIEAVLMATKDYFTAALTDGSYGSLLFQHGQAAGNIVDFVSTRADIGDVSYSDLDGIHMITMPYTAIPSTAGNDEFSLVYT